jgi:3-(3-hydroxy-phenyl)propionate hydroxylase
VYPELRLEAEAQAEIAEALATRPWMPDRGRPHRVAPTRRIDRPVRSHGREAVTEHQVVIVGSGPAGMMLAAELVLAQVDVAVIERRPDQGLAGSRAGGFHARALELLDQRSVTERFLAEGHVHAVMPFNDAMLRIDDLPTRHPYTLGIFQNEIERIMGAWLAELSVRVHHGREVTAFAPSDTGVEVTPRSAATSASTARPGSPGSRTRLVRPP